MVSTATIPQYAISEIVGLLTIALHCFTHEIVVSFVRLGRTVDTEEVVLLPILNRPRRRICAAKWPSPADELGRIAVSALLTRTGIDPGLIDEVIFGCVGQPAEAANVGRVIALRAGIPERVPAITSGTASGSRR